MSMTSVGGMLGAVRSGHALEMERMCVVRIRFVWREALAMALSAAACAGTLAASGTITPHSAVLWLALMPQKRLDTAPLVRWDSAAV